jgi:hypothetical protein
MIKENYVRGRCITFNFVHDPMIVSNDQREFCPARGMIERMVVRGREDKIACFSRKAHTCTPSVVKSWTPPSAFAAAAAARGDHDIGSRSAAPEMLLVVTI